MTNQITLPHLGENIESGDVLAIMVSVGDLIEVEQDLIEVETDKATMPVPSPEAGKVAKILVAEGDTITVGSPLLELEPTATPAAADNSEDAPGSAAPAPAAAAPAPAPATSAPAAAAPPPAADVPPPPETAPSAPPVVPAAAPLQSPAVDEPAAAASDLHLAAAAGPAIRRLARELGVDLRRVYPTGESGRITADDVQAYVRSANQQVATAAPAGITPPGILESDGHGAVRVEKMSRLRQTIARNMLKSYSTIPQLTNFDDVDVSALEAMRQQSKADYAAQGLKLTAMPFLIKAISSSLRLHPIVNASVDTENHQIIYKEYVNIGIAVDTQRGLIVPVMRDSDRLTISQITHELARLTEMAHLGSFAVEDLRGGTFTVSNLGSVGGTYSTPIINPPEVAILLVGRSRELPMYVDGEIQPRLIMPLSLTYDHSIVDGAAAARFLNEVKGFLAAPGRLLLAP
jgi:pyruvate dehydrogenase E2 component (dihydrolipoamide acetyltransferase)